MKSARFSFSISKILIKEDMKRCWMIPAMLFLIYFMLGAIPLISSTGKQIPITFSAVLPIRITFGDNYSLITALSAALIAIGAIAAAAGVFSYLHGKASAVRIHALPFNRKTLFRSHALSGWILTVIPILLSGLSFIILCAAQTAAGKTIIQHVYMPIPAQYVYHYTGWILMAVITATFVYSLAVLAGVIAANPAVHVLLAMFLNGIAPVSVYLINRYLVRFLKGLTAPPVASTDCSPLIRFYLNRYPWNSVEQMVLYCALCLAAALIFTAAAAALYKRIPLERTGDSVFFPSLGNLVCMLFAFIGMTCFGVISMRILEAESETYSNLLSFGLALIGSLLFYLAARMILEKRLQVFHKKTLKGFCLFLVFAAVFCSLTIFDITGFEKRVPAPAQVASVTIADAAGISNGDSKFDSAESIEDIVKLHQACVEEAEDYDPFTTEDERLSLSYELTNGRTLERTYRFNTDPESRLCSAYEHFYHSDAYQEKLDEGILLHKKIKTLNGQHPGFNENCDALMKQLPAAIIKDAKERSHVQTLYKETSSTEEVYSLHFNFDDGTSLDYRVTKYDKNTLALCQKYATGYLRMVFTDK